MESEGERNKPGSDRVDWKSLALAQMKLISQAERVIAALLTEQQRLQKALDKSE